MTTPTESAFPTFSDDAEVSLENPLDPDRTDHFVKDIVRGGAELVAKVSTDINEISIRRAMQIGYMLCCQDHGLPSPTMDDPAKEKGYS